MKRKFLPCTILLILGTFFCCGCGDSGKLDGLVRCEGTVKFKGSPCVGAKVMFSPIGANADTRRSAIGVTDENGYYRMTTLKANDGVYPGEYGIAIIKFEFVGEEPKVVIDDNPTKEQPSRPQENKLPKKYETYQSSQLKFTVPDAGSKDANFDIE